MRAHTPTNHTHTQRANAQVSRWTGREQAGYLHKVCPLANGDGAELEVEVEFLPWVAVGGV